MTEDHLLMEGAKSIQLFQDHLLHLEFRLPYNRRHGGRAGATADCIFRDGTRCRCWIPLAWKEKATNAEVCTGLLHPVKTCVSLRLLGKPTTPNSGPPDSKMAKR